MQTVTYKNHTFKIHNREDMEKMSESEFKEIVLARKKDLEQINALEPQNQYVPEESLRVWESTDKWTNEYEEWAGVRAKVHEQEFAMTKVGAPKGWYPKLKTHFWETINLSAGCDIAEAP